MEIEKQKQNNITVKEFRYWLEGVIEMQDEDWIPDARQWNKILEKIYEISDEQPKLRSDAGYAGYAGYAIATHPPIYPTQHVSSQLPPVLDQAPPVFAGAPSGLSGMPPQGSTQSGLFSGDGNIPVRTPNIDTSGSSYDTPFA